MSTEQLNHISDPDKDIYFVSTPVSSENRNKKKMKMSRRSNQISMKHRHKQESLLESSKKWVQVLTPLLAMSKIHTYTHIHQPACSDDLGQIECLDSSYALSDTSKMNRSTPQYVHINCGYTSLHITAVCISEEENLGFLLLKKTQMAFVCMCVCV